MLRKPRLLILRQAARRLMVVMAMMPQRMLLRMCKMPLWVSVRATGGGGGCYTGEIERKKEIEREREREREGVQLLDSYGW